MQKIVFGPIHSRRFGISLGIDLSPYQKQCNFDCLYCELGGAKSMKEMREVLSPEEILLPLFEALQKSPKLDVITLSANGEPTLYPHLLELILKIKEKIQGKYKTLILSNGSLFGKKDIQRALREFDIVKFSFDCFSERCFKKLDRPFKEIDLEEIKRGIEDFAREYQGELVAEVLVLKNLNDYPEEIEKIAQFLQKVGVARVDLGTLDRPPAYKVEGVSLAKLQELSKLFKNQCVSIPLRKEINLEEKIKLENAQDVVELLKKRPISVSEFPTLFEGSEFCQDLLQKGEIEIKKVANMDFYTVKS